MRWLLAILMLLLPRQAGAATMAELQAQDARLAVVAERIMAANAALCTQTMPITGLILHSADQYGAEEREVLFPAGVLAIALVLSGSPADKAGLNAGDVVRAIGGHNTAALPTPGDGHMREAAFDLLAGQPSDAPIDVAVERGSQSITATITAPAGCRALVEIVPGSRLSAQSDGHVIQLTFALVEALDDDGLATIFAHELAHGMLHHRARLETAGVERGLRGEFGRNRRLNRAVEVEADRMSVHLLANAGYNPAIAAEYWRGAGARRVRGLFSLSRIYPSARARGDLIADEIARYLPSGAGPTWPNHLLSLRDQPFAH